MTSKDPFDRLMEQAFAAERNLEPTRAQVAAAVRSARHVSRGVRPGRRLAIVAIASLVLAGGAVAIPQTRDALVDMFGSFADFVTGGDPPGQPVSGAEEPGRLNWFGGSDIATGSVIAHAGSVRVIAYRDSASGQACVGFGLHIEECHFEREWLSLLGQTAVLVRGPLAAPDASGHVPLVGVVAADVTTIQVTYANGADDETSGVRHGFVAYIDQARSPRLLIARRADGSVAATINIDALPAGISRDPERG